MTVELFVFYVLQKEKFAAWDYQNWLCTLFTIYTLCTREIYIYEIFKMNIDEYLQMNIYKWQLQFQDEYWWIFTNEYLQMTNYNFKMNVDEYLQMSIYNYVQFERVHYYDCLKTFHTMNTFLVVIT